VKEVDDELASAVVELVKDCSEWNEAAVEVRRFNTENDERLEALGHALDYNLVVQAGDRRDQHGPLAPLMEGDERTYPAVVDAAPDEHLRIWAEAHERIEDHLVRSHLGDLPWLRRYGDKPHLFAGSRSPRTGPLPPMGPGTRWCGGLSAAGSSALVANGIEAGDAWSLCAYRASVVMNDKPAQDALCWEFKWGPGPYSGYACTFDLGATAPPDSDYFLRTSTEPVANAGSAHPRRDNQEGRQGCIETRQRHGDRRPIYEPVPELEVEYHFFVGFAPPGSNPSVVVYDAAGNVLDRES
jgi:hypothetical protein